MPELPEVETIRRDLNRRIVGKHFLKIEILRAKKISPGVTQLRQALLGQRIQAVRRRAKLLLFDFGRWILLIHLKVTGQLVLSERRGLIMGGHPIAGLRTLPNKYTQVIFHLSGSSKLFFNDLRKFGYIKLLSQEEAQKFFSAYGPEPLSPQFTFKNFSASLSAHQTLRLKSYLLDQKNVSGLGNIYVDESCFRARLRPDRRIKTLTLAEQRKLYQAIKRVLQLALRHRGTSFNTYVISNGRAGRFRQYLQVYGRRGRPCRRCGTMIVKTKLAGRGTHYCPKCQK